MNAIQHWHQEDEPPVVRGGMNKSMGGFRFFTTANAQLELVLLVISSHGSIRLSQRRLPKCCWTCHHNDWKLQPLPKESLFINNPFVSRSFTIYTAHTNASARWLWLSYDTVLIRSVVCLSSRGSITVVRTHNNYARRLCPYLPWQEPWRTLLWILVLNQTFTYIWFSGGRDVLRLDNHVHRQSRLDRLVYCLSKASLCLLLVLIISLRSKRSEQTGSTTPWTTRRSLHWPCKASSFGRLVQDLRFLEKGIR